MPHTLRASSAPRSLTGLTVDHTRTGYDGLALRVRRVAAVPDRPAGAELDEPTDVVPDQPSGVRDPGQRRAVVLVHGLGLSSQYLERLAASLSPVGPVYLLDLPGFGGVPRPGRTPSIPDLARLVARWVREAGLVDPVLLGQSMGAQVVTEMLAADPGLSTRAVLVGLTVDDTERTARAQLGRFAQSAIFESARTLRLATRAYARSGVPWITRVLRSTLEYPTEERLPAVEASLLVVRGSHDHIASRAWVERMAGLAPRARVVEVAGAGHIVVDDHADEVAALLVEHLGR